jgi:MFS family permease
MGSVLALKAFKEDFGLPTDSSGFSDSKNASVSSNVVSLLTAGCFFGAIAAAWFNERFGRRLSLMGFFEVWSFTFLILSSYLRSPPLSIYFIKCFSSYFSFLQNAVLVSGFD